MTALEAVLGPLFVDLTDKVAPRREYLVEPHVLFSF